MNPLQIVYAVISVAMLAGVGGYIWHCHSVTAEYAAFKDGVEKAGKKAQADKEKQEAKDKIAKEKEDAQRELDRARIADLSKRLRDARSRSSFVPPASPLATSPHRATFDRAILERTIQQFDEGVSGIVAEGDVARVDLDTAKRWAQEVSRPAQP